MDEMLGNADLEHAYYCYSFMEVGSVMQKGRKVKIMYSQDGVSLSHEKGKTLLVITRTYRQTGGPPLTTVTRGEDVQI